METKIEPLGSYILVREIKNEKKGGLLIPDSVKEQIQKASVVAVSVEVDIVKPGDTVLYQINKGHQIGDNKLVLAHDLMGKL